MNRRQKRDAERLDALLQIERDLQARGFARIAGCDEVGVGSLAGPVVAAAVILPLDAPIPGIDDSKVLSPARRVSLAEVIRSVAVSWAIGFATVEEIDRLNIYHAALEAMRRAVAGLDAHPDYVLADARQLPGLRVPQLPLVRGDARSYSVAAASILAKVHRDALMREYHAKYPRYGFDHNAGYGTPEHLAALQKYGPCPLHRKSFAPVRQLGLFDSPKPRASKGALVR